MEFNHNGVIMKFSNKKIMEKVKKRLLDAENNIPLQIIQNEERLLLSDLWVPCKVKNSDELDEIKNLYRLKNYRNRYSAACYCGGSIWKLGFEMNTDCSQSRCSNPDCKSSFLLPIIFE